MKPLDLCLMLAIMLVWGGNFVVAKLGLAEIPPILFMALRFGIAAAVLVPFVRMPREKLGPIALLSFTLGCAHFSTMFTAVDMLDAATSSILIQIQVPFAALLSALFMNDPIGWRRALGMAIAFGGVVVIAGEPRFAGSLWPIMLVMIASFLWAVANIQIKLLGAVDGYSLNAYMALFATPQLVLTSFLIEDGQIAALAAASWVAWSAILFQAIVIAVVTYAAWCRLVRDYSVNQTMPFTLLVPVFGVIAGVVLLGDPLTWSTIIGGVATILGVAIIVLRRPRLPEPEAAAKTT